MQVVDAAEELRLTEALSVDGELSPGVGSSCQIDSENRAGGSPYPVAFNLYRIALTLFREYPSEVLAETLLPATRLAFTAVES